MTRLSLSRHEAPCFPTCPLPVPKPHPTPKSAYLFLHVQSIDRSHNQSFEFPSTPHRLNRTLTGSGPRLPKLRRLVVRIESREAADRYYYNLVYEVRRYRFRSNNPAKSANVPRTTLSDAAARVFSPFVVRVRAQPASAVDNIPTRPRHESLPIIRRCAFSLARFIDATLAWLAAIFGRCRATVARYTHTSFRPALPRVSRHSQSSPCSILRLRTAHIAFATLFSQSPPPRAWKSSQTLTRRSRGPMAAFLQLLPMAPHRGA